MAQVQSSPTNWICNIWYLLFQNCLDLILNESFIFLFRSFSKLMVRKDLYKFYLFEEKHDVIFVDSRLENSNDWQLKKLFTFKKLASNYSSSQKLSFKGGFAWRLRLSYVHMDNVCKKYVEHNLWAKNRVSSRLEKSSFQ